MLVGSDQNNRIAQASTIPDYRLFDQITKNAQEFCSNISQSQWDFDWDKREPATLVRPLKNPLPSEDELKKQGEKLEMARSRATRNLILIRHGQYNLKGSCDEERKLTSLVSGYFDWIILDQPIMFYICLYNTNANNSLI